MERGKYSSVYVRQHQAQEKEEGERKMSRPAHFLDNHRFQIEEMVKLRCTDDHILKVLHDTQKDVQFSKETLVHYMDKTGIRKRRIVKGWTQKQVFEWEEYCENLRGNERIKGMLIVQRYKEK